MTSEINELIHKSAVRAFVAGREDAIHEMTKTLQLKINDLLDYFYDNPVKREVVEKLQSEVEALAAQMSKKG